MCQPTFTQWEIIESFSAHVAMNAIIIGFAAAFAIVIAGDANATRLVAVARHALREIVVARAALVTRATRKAGQTSTGPGRIADRGGGAPFVAAAALDERIAPKSRGAAVAPRPAVADQAQALPGILVADFVIGSSRIAITDCKENSTYTDKKKMIIHIIKSHYILYFFYCIALGFVYLECPTCIGK